MQPEAHDHSLSISGYQSVTTDGESTRRNGLFSCKTGHFTGWHNGS
jgi:hypothetical protein